MVKRTTTVRLDELDLEAIRVIQERWGLPSSNAAVTFAARVVAQSERIGAVPSGPGENLGEVIKLRLAPADEEAILSIRKRWNRPSDSDAIRFALHALASADRLEIIPARPEPE
jgi:hypothetical protein